MIEEKNYISGRQFFAIVYGSILGVNFVFLPRYLLTIGSDFLWSLLLSALYPLAFILCSCYLHRYFAADSVAVYGKKLIGKWGIRVFSLLYFVFGVLELSNLLFLFSESINAFALTKMSVGLILLVIIGLCTYFALHNFQTIARVNELLFYLLLVLIFFAFPVIPEIKTMYYTPFFQTSLSTIAKKACLGVGLYYSIDSILIYGSFVRDKKSAATYAFWAIAAVTLTYLLLFTVILGFFGPEAVNFFSWPVLSMLNAVGVPILDRMESLFTFFWVMLVYRAVGIRLFSISYFVQKSFGLTKRCWLVFGAMFSVFALYLFVVYRQWSLYNFLGQRLKLFMPMANLALLVLLFIIALYKKRKEEQLG